MDGKIIPRSAQISLALCALLHTTQPIIITQGLAHHVSSQNGIKILQRQQNEQPVRLITALPDGAQADPGTHTELVVL